MCRGQRETVGYSERTIVRYPQGMVRRTSLKAPVLACLLPQHRLFHGGAAVRQCWPIFCPSTACSTAVQRHWPEAPAVRLTPGPAVS